MTKVSKRQKALEYLIEFILVIVGISIAFWLSEQAEESKKDELEKQYLSDLKEDLQADIDLIDYLTVLNQGQTSEVERALDYLSGKPSTITQDSIPHFAEMIGNPTLFYPNDFTYISLKQSGDFKIIKNHEIRKLLVRLYSSYESLDQEQTNLVNAIEDHFFPEYLKNYELATKKVINSAYFRSPILSNFMTFTCSQTNTILVYFERSKTIAEQTIGLIEEELE
jgi:hypothetical protein